MSIFFIINQLRIKVYNTYGEDNGRYKNELKILKNTLEEMKNGRKT